MKLIPFLPEHAEGILNNAVEKVDVELVSTTAQRYNSMGPAYSAENADGVVVGCGGLLLLSPGVAHAWAIFDKDLIRMVSPTWLYRTILENLGRLRGEYNLRRVQTDCEAENPVFAQFILNLGFQPEGVLRKYGLTGKDHIMFSIVEGD